MKQTDERTAAAPDAVATWFATQEKLLTSLQSETQLPESIRTAAAEAMRGLPETREAWTGLYGEVARQRKQLSVLREELNGLEKTMGRVYNTLEEETWTTEPRGGA